MVVNKTDLYKEVAKATGFAYTNVDEVMDALYDVLIEHMKNMEDVILFPGVMFKPKFVPDGDRFVPTMGVQHIPEHINVKARVLDAFRERVNS